MTDKEKDSAQEQEPAAPNQNTDPDYEGPRDTEGNPSVEDDGVGVEN